MKEPRRVNWYYIICPIIALFAQYYIIIFGLLSPDAFYTRIIIGNLVLIGILLLLARSKRLTLLRVGYAVGVCVMTLLIYKYGFQTS